MKKLIASVICGILLCLLAATPVVAAGPAQGPPPEVQELVERLYPNGVPDNVEITCTNEFVSFRVVDAAKLYQPTREDLMRAAPAPYKKRVRIQTYDEMFPQSIYYSENLTVHGPAAGTLTVVYFVCYYDTWLFEVDYEGMLYYVNYM